MAFERFHKVLGSVNCVEPEVVLSAVVEKACEWCVVPPASRWGTPNNGKSFKLMMRADRRMGFNWGTLATDRWCFKNGRTRKAGYPLHSTDERNVSLSLNNKELIFSPKTPTTPNKPPPSPRIRGKVTAKATVMMGQRLELRNGAAKANNQKRENCKGNPQNPTEKPSTPLQLTQKDLMREMALETQPTTRKPPISPKTLKPPLSPKSVLQSKVSQKSVKSHVQASVPAKRKFLSHYEVKIKLKKPLNQSGLSRSQSSVETGAMLRKSASLSSAAYQLRREISQEEEKRDESPSFSMISTNEKPYNPPRIFRDDRGREIFKKAPLVRARSAVLHRSLSRSHSVTFIVQTAPRLDGLPEETIVRIAQNLSPSDLRSLSQTSRSIREQILKNRRRCGLTEIHEIHFTYQWDFDHYPLPPYETWNDVLLDSKKMMIQIHSTNEVTPTNSAQISSVEDFELFARVVMPGLKPSRIILNDLSEEFLLILVRGITSANWQNIDHIQVKDTWKTMTPLTRTKILAATRSRRMSIRAADEIVNRREFDVPMADWSVPSYGSHHSYSVL
ncbi:unnamed protein product, partial [Mesorhabditis belari]|uniref:F-box domain-containing protein n=1 Tax=Mesorhabditis belari TaxID=2138241 RepID=A0AAF3FDU9_9BILA